MRERLRFFVAWLCFVFLLVWAVPAEAQPGSVLVLHIKGPVTPVMLSYIQRGIREAEADGDELLVIELDTPGGSVVLMEEIIKAIRGSGVPVVVYVAPRGAWAASAGTLITLAGHFAAMAPETSIGAASPVGSQGEDLGETIERKEKEILKATARTLAERRGEEAVAWAEDAIERARAISAEEALRIGAIDAVAVDLNDLLRQLDGRTAELADGRQVTLHLAGVHVKEFPMNPIERFLHTITDPNIAIILLTLGINALIFEMQSPGGYVLGILGAIAIGLALYAMGVLSVDYTGLLFIGLAFILFIVDLKAPGGVLTLGGSGPLSSGRSCSSIAPPMGASQSPW